MKALRTTVFIAVTSFLTYLFFHVASFNSNFSLPTLEKPMQWYFTELNAPLRSVIVEAINSAKSSLLVVIYQLRDEKVIEAIREKSESGIPTYVVVDSDGYDAGRKGLGKNTTLIKRKSPGIMHEKILIVDKAEVYLGSTNFTFESLNLHANDWIGVFSPTLAEKAWQRIKKMNAKGRIEPGFAIHGKVENRPIEMWFTPNPDALKKVGQLIDQAKVSIKLAMFTFTQPELTQKLLEAKRRGVSVIVATDAQQSKNVNKAALQQMKEAREYLGVGLFHHKFAWIDGHTLVVGSLNWTKQAFTQNDDCFMIIHQLTESDQSLLNRVWEEILHKTKGNTYASRTSGLWEDGKDPCNARPLLWTHDHLYHHPLLAERPHTRKRHPGCRSIS
jgi:hypothetical protein